MEDRRRWLASLGSGLLELGAILGAIGGVTLTILGAYHFLPFLNLPWFPLGEVLRVLFGPTLFVLGYGIVVALRKWNQTHGESFGFRLRKTGSAVLEFSAAVGFLLNTLVGLVLGFNWMFGPEAGIYVLAGVGLVGGYSLGLFFLGFHHHEVRGLGARHRWKSGLEHFLMGWALPLLIAVAGLVLGAFF